jgi:hypothetical protein
MILADVPPPITAQLFDAPWLFLVVGYLITVSIEAPVLLLGLSRRHPWPRRLFAGFWLTACTYPIVVIVLPPLFDADNRFSYLLVAEVFAPVAECALFWLAFGTRELWWTRGMARDFAVIVAANLLSFGIGEWLNEAGWTEAIL